MKKKNEMKINIQLINIMKKKENNGITTTTTTKIKNNDK
jgi:hypothetical protein